MVFKRLKDFNLKIIPNKCHFFQGSVLFLGYVLSAHSISASPDKLEKVQNFPVSSNQEELYLFLGLTSYYKHFIPKFTAISKCLHELVGATHINKDRKVRQRQSQNNDFQWADEYQKAFNLLKGGLTRATALGYPDFSHAFDLETDASLQGLGAFLY